MGTIKDEAKAYEPPQTKNISDLDKVPTDIEIEERIYKRRWHNLQDKSYCCG